MKLAKPRKIGPTKLVLLLVVVSIFGQFCCQEIQLAESVSRRNDRLIDNTLKASIEDSLKTKILILASPHLKALGESFNPSMLDSLLFVLEHYRPDLIAVESMPPSLIEEMERKKGNFTEVLNQFAKDRIENGHIAQRLLGINRKEAEQKADSLLDVMSKQSKYDTLDEARLSLVVSMLASYDLNSALLQWSYLSDDLRIRNEVIPGNISTYLDEELKSPDEIVAIGVRLAKRLGLQRVESIDDHQEKDTFLKISTQLVSELQANSVYRSAANSPFYIDSEKRLQDAAEDGFLLRHYLYLNSSQYTSTDVATQWGLFFKTGLPSGLDRSRVALWEVRNLNVASRIRQSTVLYPGKRVLVIVGASHKPFLDAYLSQMMDVQLVNLDEILSKFYE
ncbi:MAG: hypothetical protein GTO24_19410 [candidate division Zixibacteria bacterium]|nr:hypothetical protein [candidate division Zixibacteria bacterium]